MKQDGYFPGTDDKAEGSAVFIDNKTGGVIAAIGGRDYVSKGYNRAVASRQPGSTFKPLAVYGPALEEKLFKPYSLLEDKQLSYDGYSPKNYDGQYEGKVSMVDALTYSKNAPAVWTLHEVGIETVKPYLSRLGMNIPDEGLALGLGGLQQGVSPLEVAGAYRTFANMGEYEKPYFIQKIRDESGNVLYRHKKKPERVFSKQTAWYMTRMLQEVVRSGTGKAGEFSGEIAGKTGTTTYTGKEGATNDAWFAGYTPKVTGAVWMGYDKTDEKHYLTGGSSYPTRLYKDILKRSNQKPAAFKKPEGVKDLYRPIHLEDVDSAEAGYSFTPMGLITVSLKWHEQEDKRAEYRIYEKKNGKERLVDTVKGKGSYDIPYANLFSDASYRIVPYNPQTKEEGNGTDFIKPKVFPSGH